MWRPNCALIKRKPQLAVSNALAADAVTELLVWFEAVRQAAAPEASDAILGDDASADM